MRRGGYFDLDATQSRIKELQGLTANPDFWSNQDKATAVNQELSDLQKEIDTWQGIRQEIQDAIDVAELAQEENDESMHDEFMTRVTDLEARFEKLEFHILFDGEYDKNNAILAFHAGSGGTEAQDWSEMLFRMITRFAEDKDWKIEIIDMNRGSEAGIKSAMIRVQGRYAYAYLKSENGVHRLVRISPFDAEKMRHTSFAMIEVLPEIDDSVEVNIDPKDLRIDTFAAGGKGGQKVNTTNSAVRIVHLPTKISVACQNERSQAQNKETAMKILKAKLHKLELEKQAEAKEELRGEYQSAEWGNQIRSYVLHPYKMVKDHRSTFESKEPMKVLDGELEPFMEAYLRWRKEK
jgi:peptide chain release factor 2